jgi:hypothetical protein
LLHLAFPFQVRRCALLEVKVTCEGKGETFVQALLVEEEGGLERVQVSGQLRRAGEDDTGIDGVGG